MVDSVLEVQNIKLPDSGGTTGANVFTSTGNVPTIASGVTFPAGHIVQTKFVYFDDIQTIGNGSTTGTTFTTIGSGVTGKEFSIPMSVSQGNVIFGMGTVNITDNSRYSGLKIFSDSTQIAMGLASSNRTQVTSSSPSNLDETSYQYIMYQSNFSFIHTPANTNSFTYTIKAGNTYDNTIVTYINRSQSDADANYSHRGYSHFILMEISQ